MKSGDAQQKKKRGTDVFGKIHLGRGKTIPEKKNETVFRRMKVPCKRNQKKSGQNNLLAHEETPLQT